MATIVTPRKRARVNRKWIIGGAVVAVLVLAAIIAFVMLRSASGTAATETPGWTTATANTGTIDAAVSATGSVEAQAQADLRFAADGTVTAILVKPGQLVQAGQALARLDATDLQLKVEQAQADLKQAQADYQQLMDKASPQEISAAQARVAQAKGQYHQAAGSVTKAEQAIDRWVVEIDHVGLFLRERSKQFFENDIGHLVRRGSRFTRELGFVNHGRALPRRRWRCRQNR